MSRFPIAPFAPANRSQHSENHAIEKMSSYSGFGQSKSNVAAVSNA